MDQVTGGLISYRHVRSRAPRVTRTGLTQGIRTETHRLAGTSRSRIELAFINVRRNQPILALVFAAGWKSRGSATEPSRRSQTPSKVKEIPP